MSDLPVRVSDTRLWARLSEEQRTALVALRETAESLGETIRVLIPSYTDHSIKHMDSLWSVADHVFNEAESRKFSRSEAFVLGCCFYVHDLGMAFAATPIGLSNLRGELTYKSHYDRARFTLGLPLEEADISALRLTARDLHAKNAVELIDAVVPGLDRFLLESTSLREKWGAMIGEIAASHHWSLREVEQRLGIRGKVPTSDGESIDPAFVACALRIIDYAHINRQRASSLARILRAGIDAESLRHWDAQQFVTGPHREGNQLVFGCTRPLNNVDAWWTFYEMASGLDREISAVLDYLEQRVISAGRFSLDGVRGVKSPQSFAVFIRADNFEPVDVRFRPDSMERLIELVGGKTLYGNDRFAPVRELIQNARDAALLLNFRATAARTSGRDASIAVELSSNIEGGELVVADNGVGMSERVITNYLLGVAADFWSSSEFYADYPGVSDTGFKPVGRFGIGFLSVFMVGRHVEVKTQRINGPNLTLHLRGVGRRGSLIRDSPSLTHGTRVKVFLPAADVPDYEDLAAIILAKAPMLEMPVTVQQGDSFQKILPGWWKTVSQEHLFTFLNEQPLVATTPRREISKKRESAEHESDLLFYRQLRRIGNKWPSVQPEVITDEFRLMAVPGRGGVLICSRGFALTFVEMRGIVGIANINEVEINAARSQVLEWDRKGFTENALDRLSPRIVEALDNLSTESDLPSLHGFLVNVAECYGRKFLILSSLPWITVVSPPGNSSLLSVKSFCELIKDKNEILIGYGDGVNPWSCRSLSRGIFPEAKDDAVIVPVGDSGHTDVGTWEDGDESIWGSLEDHFQNGDMPILLLTILNLVAERFDLSIEEIKMGNWSRKKRALCGLVKRVPEV